MHKKIAQISYEELPTFLSLLKLMDGMGARCLEMAILTCLRTKEWTGAKWSEINLDKQLWTAPKERMKKGVEHRIPLSGMAMKLLTKLSEQRINDYVFPSPSKMVAFQMGQWMPYSYVKDTSPIQSMDSDLHSVTASQKKPTLLGAEERKP